MGLARSDGKNFALTPAILSLGQAFLSGHSEIELIRESLVAVTTETGESASAAMLDGTEVVYIARSPAPHRIMTIALSVGTRLPAHATSMGQALLAYLHPRALERYIAAAKLQRYTSRTLTGETQLRRRLAEVRAQGYALVSDELEVGLRALSIPVLERDGSVRFAVNLSAHSARISEADMQERLRPVLARAELAIRNAIEQRAQTDVVPLPETDGARERRSERRGAVKGPANGHWQECTPFAEWQRTPATLEQGQQEAPASPCAAKSPSSDRVLRDCCSARS